MALHDQIKSIAKADTNTALGHLHTAIKGTRAKIIDSGSSSTRAHITYSHGKALHNTVRKTCERAGCEHRSSHPLSHGNSSECFVGRDHNIVVHHSYNPEKGHGHITIHRKPSEKKKK